jgi:hypothetical protein
MANGEIDIRWKVAGFYQLRSAPPVKEALERVASQIAADADRLAGTSGGFMVSKPEFRTGSKQGRKKPQGRWRTTVITANATAMRKNAKHNILIRALDG